MPRLGRGARVGTVVMLVALLAALPLDTALHDLTFRYVVSHDVRLVANGFTRLGTAWAAAGVLGGLAAMARWTADTPLLRATLGGLIGIAVGSAAIQVVKHVACRARPHFVEGWGVDAVSPANGPAPPFSGGGFFHWPCFADSRYHSFPSGHTTVAFAVAAALSQVVPTRRRLWIAVAVGVGLSRVVLNAHFLSDIVGGALLGWWAGYLGVVVATRLAPLPATAPAAVGVESGREAGASLR
jgi:membrane-associated phospholipid phosphatase